MRILWKAQFVLAIAGACEAQQAAVQVKSGIGQDPERMQARPTARVTLPDGAKELADGSLSYTDKDGKEWVYRRTPFGVTRTEKAAVQPDRTESGNMPWSRSGAVEQKAGKE